jgi:hypothetical protein
MQFCDHTIFCRSSSPILRSQIATCNHNIHISWHKESPPSAQSSSLHPVRLRSMLHPPSSSRHRHRHCRCAAVATATAAPPSPLLPRSRYDASCAQRPHCRLPSIDANQPDHIASTHLLRSSHLNPFPPLVSNSRDRTLVGGKSLAGPNAIFFSRRT